jgi:hypothetical protein
MIIPRKEELEINRIKKWICIYGRRKTGKTFLVRHSVKYDEYFFVKRDKAIIRESTNTDVSYETMLELLTHLLNENKTVVVDEFHRLGNDFLDRLHFMKKNGKLIVISSTFHLAKKLVSENSPIFGVFAEFPLGLIKLGDIIAGLPQTDKKQLVELSIFMSEPLVIDYYHARMTSKELCRQLLSTMKILVSALVGETFNEEERTLTNVYSGILRAVASGKVVSTEISSYLFSKKLIPKDNPGGIQPYLHNLMEIGLIRRVKVINKNRYIYEHISPLIELYYYGDEKYNLGEITVDEAHITGLFESKFPKIVERCLRTFLAQKFGLLEGVVIEGDYEIDAYLMRMKKCEIAVEIKWKDKIGKDDIARAEEVLSKVTAKRRLLFVPDKKKAKFKSSKIEIVDIGDFV